MDELDGELHKFLETRRCSVPPLRIMAEPLFQNS